MMTEDTHIKIYDTAPWVQHTADGKETEFTYPFEIFKDGDLEVFIGQTPHNSGFRVTGAGKPLGDRVIFDTPPAAGTVLTFRRDLPIERTHDPDFNIINDDLDRMTAQIQQVALEARRGLKLSPTDRNKTLTLPLRDERAGKMLGFDDAGNPSTAVSFEDISQADQRAQDAQAARVAAQKAQRAAETALRDAETIGDQATNASQQAQQYRTEAQTARDETRAALQDARNAATATKTEAETGTDNSKLMTPLRVKQAVNARLATKTEAETGTDNVKLMTPLRVKQAILQHQVPAGTIIAWASADRPVGYFHCNGARLKRENYPDLFAAIGTTFGAGDGRTTFLLPDLRGEFLRGWDKGRGVDPYRVFGSLQYDEIKSHRHLRYLYDFGTGRGNGNNPWSAGMQGDRSGESPQWTGPHGGSETRPRNIAIMFCIKY